MLQKLELQRENIIVNYEKLTWKIPHSGVDASVQSDSSLCMRLIIKVTY